MVYARGSSGQAKPVCNEVVDGKESEDEERVKK